MVTHMNILLNFLLRTLAALAVSLFAYSYRWWAGLVAFPIVTVLWCRVFRPKWPTQARYLMETKSQETIKSMFFRMLILFAFASVVVFQVNVGSWYGWAIGGGFGLASDKWMLMEHKRWLGFYS